jgi:hypothetical protein
MNRILLTLINIATIWFFVECATSYKEREEIIQSKHSINQTSYEIIKFDCNNGTRRGSKLTAVFNQKTYRISINQKDCESWLNNPDLIQLFHDRENDIIFTERELTTRLVYASGTIAFLFVGIWFVPSLWKE